MIDRLVARVFATRSTCHLQHWKTKSYAEHVALGEFYPAIIEQIDEIVECYQGRMGIINVGFDAQRPGDNIVEHLTAEAAWIVQNRKEIAAGIPAIENLLDELTSTYLRALYKLKNLK